MFTKEGKCFEILDPNGIKVFMKTSDTFESPLCRSKFAVKKDFMKCNLGEFLENRMGIVVPF